MQISYIREGLLAIAPDTFGASIDLEVLITTAQYQLKVEKGVGVIEVVGPLEHHTNPILESYDHLKATFKEACDHPEVQKILLSIDSPGGLVAGAFDTARELRALADAARKPYYVYVDSQVCSAAMALAAPADEIFVPESGRVGSIGVINAVKSVARGERAMGIDYAVIGSGLRKTDGNPHVVITDEALESLESDVNRTADIFFALVGKFRGHKGLTAEKCRSLQAAILTGQEAIDVGMADTIATYDEAFAMVAEGREKQVGNQMAKAYEDAIAALRKVAAGDDDEAAKAKRMLKAELDDEPAKAKGDEPDGDETPPEDDESARAETPDPDKPKESEEAKALKAATAQIAAMAARIQKLEAKDQAHAISQERVKLLASRNDLSAETRSWLQTADIAVVRDAIKNLPKGAGQAIVPALPGSVAPTIGGATGSLPEATALIPDEHLDAIMGIEGAGRAEVKTFEGVDDRGEQRVLKTIKFTSQKAAREHFEKINKGSR
jgi:capsid assembly protease